MHEPLREEEARATEAIHAMLVEIGQVLLAYVDCFVVIGPVPWLLLPDAPPRPLDALGVDLCLDPGTLECGGDEYLMRHLQRSGYQRRQESLCAFEMVRTLSLGEGEPFTVALDFLLPSEATLLCTESPVLAGFRVWRAEGGAVALQALRVPRPSGGRVSLGLVASA